MLLLPVSFGVSFWRPLPIAMEGSVAVPLGPVLWSLLFPFLIAVVLDLFPHNPAVSLRQFSNSLSASLQGFGIPKPPFLGSNSHMDLSVSVGFSLLSGPV